MTHIPAHASAVLSRRHFCIAAGTWLMVLRSGSVHAQGATGVHFSVAEFDRSRILTRATEAVARGPITLIGFEKPQGGDPHLFYSDHAAGFSVRSDQEEKRPFLKHEEALRHMSSGLSSLVAAWRLTGQEQYFKAASVQASAWFLDERTRMSPTLESAGVQPGLQDDRRNGIVHTVALAESARALAFLCAAPAFPEQDANGLRAWFKQMLGWFTESAKGSIARQSKTLDAICWAMQVAEFARFTRNDEVLRSCSHLFRDSLLRQLSFEGSFPLALRDENPYSTSMFTLECLASTCESLSTPFESLWKYNLPDGRGMHSAVAWAAPYLRDRGKWPFLADQHNFKAEPVRQNSLLFAGRAYDLSDYTDLWKSLPPVTPALEPEHPITEPVLWATRPPA